MNQTIRDAPSIGKPDIKLKGVLSPLPSLVKDFPMIYIQEDRNINFPTSINDFEDDDESMFEEINIELLDVNESESIHSFHRCSHN